MRNRAERRVLSALREGRREAYESVIDAYYGSIYRFLFLLTRRASQAEDLTQEVFTTAWQVLERFEGRASLKTWLHRIAYNTFLDEQRRVRRHSARSRELAIGAAEAIHDPMSELVASEASARVREALAGLDVEDRAVLVLHYVEGLSYREMTAVLDQPGGTVKWLTRRALMRLRHRLTERCDHE